TRCLSDWSSDVCSSDLNLGLNNIQGPGMFQFNVALSRSFHVHGEHRILQIRAESFNLPNHMNPSNPTSNLASSTFGQTLSDISEIVRASCRERGEIWVG